MRNAIISGAIIFGSDQEVREVMRAVRRKNATGTFSWIGSDGWSARNLVSDGNEPEVNISMKGYDFIYEYIWLFASLLKTTKSRIKEKNFINFILISQITFMSFHFCDIYVG